MIHEVETPAQWSDGCENDFLNTLINSIVRGIKDPYIINHK